MGSYRYYIFEVRENYNNKFLINLLGLISQSDNIRNMDLKKELLNKDDDYRVWLEDM